VYIRERYLPNNPAEVHNLIRCYPLAAIVSRDALELTANHLPLILDSNKGPQGTLIGHMARANPQYEALRKDPHVLAVFAGPSGYVSSSWHPERDSASTWNYAAVHCHGRLAFSSDHQHTLWTIQVLLDQMEKDRPNSWKMSELGESGIKRRLPFIIGFEIVIERIEAKFQMSQYERAEDTREAIRVLTGEGNCGLAKAMRDCNVARLSNTNKTP
jgi:transcriptional regulator